MRLLGGMDRCSLESQPKEGPGAPAGSSPEAVPVLPWRGSKAQLLARLRGGGPEAGALLFDLFSDDVNRVVRRVMGQDRDHDDLVQEIFYQLLSSVSRLRDADRLRAWVMQVAVNTLRSEIRRRRVRRLVFAPRPADPARVRTTGADHDGRALLQRTYALLDRLPANERIAFTLRHVDERPLQELAELCGCSLATIKRRLARAERRFERLASRDPDLADRLSRGRRRRTS